MIYPEEDYSTVVETLAIDDIYLMLILELKKPKVINTSQPRGSLKEYLKSKYDNETTRLVQNYEKKKAGDWQIQQLSHLQPTLYTSQSNTKKPTDPTTNLHHKRIPPCRKSQ